MASMSKVDRGASKGREPKLAPDPVDRRGRTSLIRATIAGNLADVVQQIDDGADVNATDSAAWSALHFAAQQYRLEIAHALILAGARVDAVDNYGNTPLFRAVFASRGRGDLIRELVRAGADADHKNVHGESAHELAQTISGPRLPFLK
jgi:ankyrin repeat protein